MFRVEDFKTYSASELLFAQALGELLKQYMDLENIDKIIEFKLRKFNFQARVIKG